MGSSFDAIFSDFTTRANTTGLNDEDCTTLERTYQAWSSFYEAQNNDELFRDNLDQIPIYNVNPHNSSYQYWLLEREKGVIPESGLTLFHADTHTDLGHIHEHIRDDVYSSLYFDEIPLLLAELSDGKEAFLEFLRDSGDQDVDHSEIEAAFASQSVEEIRETLYRISADSVHQVAQPLVAAGAAGLTKKYVLCMPPWSTRMPRNNLGADGKIQFDEELEIVSSYTGYGKEREVHLAGIERDHPVLFEHGDGIAPVWERESNDITITDGISLGTIDCNTEELTEDGTVRDRGRPAHRVSQTFGDHERENGFILDIDLDAFVSEGYSEDHIMPISFARTDASNLEHREVVGDHGSHAFQSETDSRIEVSSTEMDLIRSRVDYLFDELTQAKVDGYLPKVITISDSTVLQRMIEGGEDSTLSGGNFTPSCLSFLLNYMVKSKLRKLYNLQTTD